MTVHIVGGLGLFHHRRMIEDLRSSAADLLSKTPATRPMSAPLALLGQFGGDILYARSSDAGGFGVRQDQALHAMLGQLVYRRAFHGALSVSWLLVALALGRKDLHEKFRAGRRFDVEKAMHWLVLYGVDEHGLWRFLSRDFVAELRTRSIPHRGGFLSPLDIILLRERPDLLGDAIAGTPEFAAGMDDWIERNGVHEYKLFWALDATSLSAMAARGDATERIGGRTKISGSASERAVALLELRASGRLDIFIDAPEQKSEWLDGLSPHSGEQRRAALSDFAEAEIAGGAGAAPVRPATLSADSSFTALSFAVAGTGADQLAMGFLGRPTGDASPALSPTLTFARPDLGNLPMVFLLDMSVADPEAMVLARIDGEPSDLFSAAWLNSRVGKIFAGSARAGATPTLELEFLSPRGPGAPPYGAIANLTIFAAPYR